MLPWIVVAAVLLSITSALPEKNISTSDAEKPIVLPPAPFSVLAKKGLTFTKENHLVQFGIDLVGCRNWSDPRGMDCNAYSGDTLCSELRPVLCTRVDNTPRPAYPVSNSGYFYAGWNRGHIATTVPVKGAQFVNRTGVDTFCANSFGTGWGVATFHDGRYIVGMNEATFAGAQWSQRVNATSEGGWHFYSYGNLRNDVRFWVHIRDQPSTCWAK